MHTDHTLGKLDVFQFNIMLIFPPFQLEYRMPIEMIQTRVLQATVWNHDTLQENEFLGGVTIPLQNLDLSKETVSWHTLGNILR